MASKRDNKIYNLEKPKVFFWSLSLVIIMGIFTYGYLVRSAIVNIVNRQTMESSILILSSKVLSLESEYVRSKNNITVESAGNYGFIAVATSSQKFVTRNPNALGLSVNLR